MNKPKQLSVGKQMLLTFGVLCAILVAIGTLLFFSLRSIERNSQEHLSYVVDESELVAAATHNVGLMQAMIFRHVLATDPGEMKLQDQAIHDIDKANAEQIAAYQRFVDTKEEGRRYARILQARKKYMELTESLLALSRASRDAEVREFAVSKQVPAYEEYQRAVKDMTRYVNEEVRDIADTMYHRIARIRMVGDVFIIVAILIAIRTGFAVTGVTHRLKEDNRALQIEVTERKRAEATLRESDEKFHQLADNITDSFWIRSPDLREVHYISPAFERIWGRSLKSLYANPNQWADFILPEDRERALAAFAALTGDTPSLDIEYRIVRPGGEIRWVHVRGFQVRDAANELIRLTGIVTDITERKQTEEELNGKTALLEAQVNSSLDGILVIDQQGNKSLQNRRFVDLLKIPPHIADETTDENRLQWVTDMTKDPEQFAEKIRHLYGHPAETSRDEMELKNGTVLDRYSSPVIGKDGRYYGRIWTFRDITERKRLEAQLLQSQKMETVGKLAGGVAHEFNSILTAIIGQSELLLGDLPAGSPMTKSVTEISKAAGRAATLTRQLLAYGRKQILQTETIDLNQVIAGMEGMLHSLMGAEVDTQIVPALDLQTVKADAGQIEQVIMNMISNARDAMPNGGKLTLETANVLFDQKSAGRYPELKPGDYVMLAITDTGTGMSAEVKARLFEPFFTTKGVGQGTGLGLSTCYGIIKQSGGHISVYSELTRGTTFKIYLPQVEQQPKIPIEHLAAPDLPRGTETVLLVEDDPALLEMAATLLRRLGYTVLTAADGIEALSVKQQRDIGHIDLLFTDIVMPHMSGKELGDRVRALYPHTRILFTSAYTENAIVHQGVLDKGVALLQKPFTPSALAGKVREVLDAEDPATVGDSHVNLRRLGAHLILR